MSYHEDEDYFKQMTSEYLDSHNRWQRKQGYRNERLDCRVYSLSAAYSLEPDWEELERSVGMDSAAYRIAPDYNPSKHQSAQIKEDKGSPIILCVDFESDPSVWLLAHSDGSNVEVFDEVVVRGGDISRLAKEVRTRYPERVQSGGFIVYGSKDNKSSYALMSELGFRVQRPNKRSDFKGGVNAINNMIEGLQGEVRLTFHPRCIMLRKDLEMALWKEDGGDIDRMSGRGSALSSLAHYIGSVYPIRPIRKSGGRSHWK